jgi:glycosyltransferase involved in cell wall biosynthesis
MSHEPCSSGIAAQLHETQGARKARLLLVLPIVPWPIRRNGISLRFAPIVDYLGQRYELDLLVLADEDAALQLNGELEQCHSLVIIKVPISSLPAWVRRIRTVLLTLAPWGAPHGRLRYAQRRLELAVLGYLKDRSYPSIIWATNHLEIACRIRRRYPETRCVIDLIDSPTLFSLRDAPTDPVFRTLRKYISWKWRRLEMKVRQAFDATIYVSSVDARTAGSDDMARVHVVPNGIYHADAPPLAKASESNRVIGFLGDMSYLPNISAALRLAERIFPRIRSTLGDATLLIIGRDPAPSIRLLDGATISVTGTVENIWPYIASVNIFVFPMFEGAGLQNKILEAMYAGVPIVTTSIAATSIGATSGEQLLVAESDDGIAAQAIKLLSDPAYANRLAEDARTFVTREFSWAAILPRYAAIVGNAISSD